MSVNNIKETIKQYFKFSIFICLFSESANFIKLYIKKFLKSAHICIIYTTLKKSTLKLCIKTNIHCKFFNCFKLSSSILVFFMLVMQNKLKFTLIIKINFKSISSSLYYKCSLTFKMFLIKLKIKYNKAIIKKSSSAVFII